MVYNYEKSILDKSNLYEYSLSANPNAADKTKSKCYGIGF